MHEAWQPRRAGGGLGRAGGPRASRLPPGDVQPSPGGGHRDGAAPGRAADGALPGHGPGALLPGDAPSLGAALPENDTLAATGTTAASAAMASQTGGGGTPALWSLCLLLFCRAGASSGRRVDRRLERATRGSLSVQALELARARGAGAGGPAEPLGHLALRPGLHLGLNAACAGLGLGSEPSPCPGPPGGAARAGLGLPGDGLRGGGHRGRGAARPAGAALWAGWSGRRW